jgi:hypothetical protein
MVIFNSYVKLPEGIKYNIYINISKYEIVKIKHGYDTI